MKKETKIKVAEGVLIAAVLVIAIYNIFFDWKAFLTISAAQVLTLLVAIVLAFWAAQWKTDERKIKEQIEKLVFKIQVEVSASNFVVFTSADTSEEVQKRITMTIRKINNSIDILTKYGEMFNIADAVAYIKDQIVGYNNCVSEKVGDIDYLSKSEAHLRMYAENINSKCDYIILQLYTKS